MELSLFVAMLLSKKVFVFMCVYCDSGDLYFLEHNNVKIHKLFWNIKIKALQQGTEEGKKN